MAIEREELKSVLQTANLLDQDKRFVLRSWEDVAGGLGRGQALINRELEQADYSIIIFGRTLGSPPGPPPTFASGAEEELLLSLRMVIDPAYPMKDVAIFFRNYSSEEEADPGESLKAVRNLRTAIARSHAALYTGYHDAGDLKSHLERLIGSWRHSPTADQSFTMSRLENLLVARGVPKFVLWPERVEATLVEAKSNLGNNPKKAEQDLSDLVDFGDRRAARVLVRHLRRTERLSDAESLAQRMIEECAQDNSEHGRRAYIYALCELGLISRRRGRHNDAKESLLSAANAAEALGDGGAEAYARENLSTTYSHLHRNAEAEREAATAARIRARSDAQHSDIETVVHRARTLTRSGRPVDAIAELQQFDLDSGQPHQASRARYYSELGEAQLGAGMPVEALASFESSASVNEAIPSKSGQIMALNQVSRAQRTLHRFEEAGHTAAQALAIAFEEGNEQGAANSRFNYGAALIELGTIESATNLLRQARVSYLHLGNLSGVKSCDLLLQRAIRAGDSPE